MISFIEQKNEISFSNIDLDRFSKDERVLLIVNKKDSISEKLIEYFSKITILELYNYDNTFLDTTTSKLLNLKVKKYDTLIFIDCLQKLHSPRIIFEMFSNRKIKGLIIAPTIQKELSEEFSLNHTFVLEKFKKSNTFKKLFYVCEEITNFRTLYDNINNQEKIQTFITYKDYKGESNNIFYLIPKNNSLILFSKITHLDNFNLNINLNINLLNYQYIYWKDNINIEVDNILMKFTKVQLLDFIKKIIIEEYANEYNTNF